MRRFKTSIVLFMICCLTYAWSSVTVSQAQSFRIDTRVRDGIIQALDGLAGHPEVIGLRDVDIENLEIGKPIPVYEVTTEGLVRQGEEWPLYCDGSIRLTAVEVPAGFQLYTYVADEIRKSELNEVAIIYDNKTFRLFDGETLYVVDEYPCDDNRESLSTVAFSTLQSICETAPIDAVQSLGYVISALRTPYVVSSSEIYDYVSYVPTRYDKYGNYLGSSGLCWAATGACIYNYVHGTHHDVLDARDYYDTCYSTSIGTDGITLLQMQDFITNHGNIGTYTVYTSITESVAYLNLYLDRPMVGCYIRQGSQVGHMVTTYGMNADNNVAYIVDPECGYLQAPYTSTSISYIKYGDLYQGVANIRRY